MEIFRIEDTIISAMPFLGFSSKSVCIAPTSDSFHSSSTIDKNPSSNWIKISGKWRETSHLHETEVDFAKISMEIEAGERAHQTKALTTKSARQPETDPRDPHEGRIDF